MTATSDPPFDVPAFAEWLRERSLTSGAITLRPIGDGHSNLTYAIAEADRRLVLRRPPPPPIPRGANDVVREARILSALRDTDVPVPLVHAVVDDDTLMGVPFYVMEHLDGEVCTDALPQAIDRPASRQAIGEAMIDALVALQAVDWRKAGLEDLGRPDGFLERQLDKLPRIIADDGGALPPRFEDLRTALRADLPEQSPAALVHGDLRLGNVMLDREQPRILGVLDWELAGIGDPLADLGYTLCTYPRPGEALHAVSAMSRATLADGFPSREELAARYASATGRDVSGLWWYEGLQLFKLAVLFEYSHRRADDPYYADHGLVDGLLSAAEHTLSKERSTG
jgi:aminoglycoside phosphotransferase (APT) family kinase protein